MSLIFGDRGLSEGGNDGEKCAIRECDLPTKFPSSGRVNGRVDIGSGGIKTGETLHGIAAA